MRKNMISRRERLKESHGCGRATAKSRGGLAAFEYADAVFQRFAVRIVVARVHKPARIRALGVSLESRGKINRRRNCPGCRINGVPGVDGESFNFHLCWKLSNFVR